MRDFYLLADHMTKLQDFITCEIREFSAVPFSLQVMFGQTSNNVMVV